ncbi:MAG: peptidase [Pseudomonadales bacterium]|nr:peptidase [Pseudomonadales bacterium]RLU03592.1 MAG: peptidase [Ketobacter sp.]
MKSVVRLVVTGSILAAGPVQASVTEQGVVKTYGDIAYAVFSDSLITAEALQSKIDALVSKPSQAALDEARAAWKQARVPYQQSEVFRFGNGIVDDWEGQLNAWPLDEGLIDYVASSNYHHEMGNVGATANIIATPSLKLGGTTLDLTDITPDLLASLNELGGSEANVATGYHAIEFLLWGQDLNGTKPGAGQRPYTDFVQGEGCTNGNCDRRVAYLKATTELLITDLKYMQEQWAPGQKNYRAELEAGKPEDALTKALFGMGSLALGELAGERMKVALEANSTEDEHDCFSDNTHFSHFYDAKGIENIYYGTYQRSDGSVVKGDSIAQLVAAKNPELAKATDQQFKDTMGAMQALVDKAEAKQPMKFDQMIAEGNQEGAELIQGAITGLVALTRKIEKVATELGVDNLSPDNADHDF